MQKHCSLQKDLIVESASTDSTDQKARLTPKETRKIVTPYAFFVADELLGTPLAGPFRRGFSILIDLFIVSLLTQVSSLVLAAIAALTFFRAGNRLETKKRFNSLRIFLRLLVALLLFIVAMGIVDEINEPEVSKELSANSSNNANNVDGIELVGISAKYMLETKAMTQQIKQGECAPAYECIKSLGQELVQDVVDVGLDTKAIEKALETYLEVVSESLSKQQINRLTLHLTNFGKQRKELNSQDKQIVVESDNKDVAGEKPNTKPKTFVAQLEDLTEELGLGLGWAAFYFSIFTAWWKGQTPGKKLMGIKVIKLDNNPLNLWESFGRYGGYAAGLATGLSGFLQVFWDPNRQAIQDKISETLVIDLRKPKVTFIKDMVE